MPHGGPGADAHHGEHGDHGGHSDHGHGDHGGHPGHGGHGGPPGRGHAALRLLAALEAHGPKSVSDVAGLIGVDQPRASRLVQAAVEAGFVRREADPSDARRSILIITEAGRTAVSATIGRRRAAIETALAGFTPAERAEFSRLLARFAAAWPHD
ncbi:MarR family winged helix-turn-helix transcriptional regulator [Agromyces sp. MMS24-K17]|uniref:MarR family winged helix-turn-helix transcriptional regulator n=1 Tax=Agromyces sp. MMS24-K17 TaxID=3372850 RepID=UPI0037549AE5